MRADTGSAWHLEHRHGSAQQLHLASAAMLGETPLYRRSARVLHVERAALVLGSSQPESDVDAPAAARAGVEIARRRSGGGAVLVDNAALVWVDLILPAGDPLWEPDIDRAAWWVGTAWANTIDRVGGGRTFVWRGPGRSNKWSKRVCFAGLGPGEVLVGNRKVVGVSQRRTRQGALFQTAALLRWNPSELLGLLRLDGGERSEAERDLAHVASGVGTVRRDALLAYLLEALPVD